MACVRLCDTIPAVRANNKITIEGEVMKNVLRKLAKREGQMPRALSGADPACLDLWYVSM